jgi:hypothetical protein
MKITHEEMAKTNARIIRINTVGELLNKKLITRNDAIEILSGCLEPGNISTLYDDSGLLDLPHDLAIIAIMGTE